MKEIQLTRGKVALVDDEDFEYLSQWKWIYMSGKLGNGYAYRSTWIIGRGHGPTILMHRDLMKTSQGMECDHIDGNGLNNQRNNLRNCTSAENTRNQQKHKGLIPYKGVYYDKTTKSWRAKVGRHHIGRFPSLRSAALAYDLWATFFFGEFAKTNFKVVH